MQIAAFSRADLLDQRAKGGMIKSELSLMGAMVSSVMYLARWVAHSSICSSGRAQTRRKMAASLWRWENQNSLQWKEFPTNPDNIGAARDPDSGRSARVSPRPDRGQPARGLWTGPGSGAGREPPRLRTPSAGQSPGSKR